ncbi:hypothetical protein VNO77_04607 [Canavalia gladiata]|uniref:Uncharacterized protein n=1 Tax=Canavalia gladiata TaxID=3824 RepID=A0AAN9R7X7_CANGL
MSIEVWVGSFGMCLEQHSHSQFMIPRVRRVISPPLDWALQWKIPGQAQLINRNPHDQLAQITGELNTMIIFCTGCLISPIFGTHLMVLKASAVMRNCRDFHPLSGDCRRMS